MDEMMNKKNGHSKMDEMIKVIGVLANNVAQNQKTITTAEIADYLNSSGYKSTLGYDYSRVDLIVRNAYEYYCRNNVQIAEYIKEYFTTRDGEKIIKGI